MYLARYRLWGALALLLLATACGGPSRFHNDYASGYYASSAVQCVPFARQASGLSLRGDADSWWYGAQGRYRQGNRPAAGAVLVLRATSRMPSGHVATVRDVLGPRSINVTHSNWGNTSRTRRIIYESMRAEDVSRANDWSYVRFWNNDLGVMGSPYAAYGFIYP